MEILTQVLELLKKHNFKLYLSKCEFLKQNPNFLEYIITEDGIKPDPDKIKAVKNFARSQNKSISEYFRDFADFIGF